MGRCCLGYSDHEIIVFPIFSETRRDINKTSILDFQRVDFSLFKRLIWRVSWQIALKKKGIKEGWTDVKKKILKVQEQRVSMRQKTSQ